VKVIFFIFTYYYFYETGLHVPEKKKKKQDPALVKYFSLVLVLKLLMRKQLPLGAEKATTTKTTVK